MTRPRPPVLVIAAAVAAICLLLLLVRGCGKASPDPLKSGSASSGASTEPLTGTGARTAPPAGQTGPTTLYAHNVLLRKGTQFRVYVRWIRGLMLPTKRDENPSFDDPDSFVLEIQKGVLHANIGDISNYLNADMPKGAPLQNISIEPSGGGLKLRGTLHKIVPLPVELDGRLLPTPDGRIQFHVNKIDVLKVPLKGLLGGFHVQLSDLVNASAVPGVQIAGNEIFFDTQKLLPAPHIRGQITSITVAPPDLALIYGNAPLDEEQLAQWHNFLRLSGGALDFGKLTMHPVDLTMIDAAPDAWFDLDLVNYQAQLVNGYTRMTAENGLEIYMPAAGDKGPKKLNPAVSLDWLKNRNTAVPEDVRVK